MKIAGNFCHSLIQHHSVSYQSIRSMNKTYPIARIKRYPTVDTTYTGKCQYTKQVRKNEEKQHTRVAKILAGIPFFKKSILLRYKSPSSFTWLALISSPNQLNISPKKNDTVFTYAVWFGNPETGIAIPVEQINPVKKMSNLECGWPESWSPICFAIGTRSTLATVWLMKVDITYIKAIPAIDLCEPLMWKQTPLPRTRTTPDKTNTTSLSERPSMTSRTIPSVTASNPLDSTPLPNEIPPIARTSMNSANEGLIFWEHVKPTNNRP